MRIFPPPVKIGDTEGFAPDKDIFKRGDFGKGLANLLRIAEDPMVVVLDGAWGSGKTTFIKMLAGHLRNEGHPVIYFDAFANDLVEDAFLAIAGQVISLSQNLKKENTSPHKKFLDKAARAGRTIVLSGAKIGIKAATLGALDAADISDLASVTKDIAQETSSKADEYLKSLLSQQREDRESIESFRKALSELATTLVIKSNKSDEQSSSPQQLIFIVDELDRCRPNFALELLEKIKHVFSVAGLHFILVTHLAQLENSVRYNYGTNIDARDYLQKFYNLIVHLPGDGKYPHERVVRKFFEYLKPLLGHDDDAVTFIAAVADARSLTLRSIEKIAVYMSLAIAFTTSKKVRYFRPGPILGGLCTLKTLEPELFQKAKSGTLTYLEASKAFEFSRWPSEHSLDWSKKWWQFALDSSLNLQGEEWRGWEERRMGEFHFEDRKDVVRFMANGIIDRMQIPEE